ncbi:MFS transporter [Pelagibacterium limicola]|uniref:MFS transporter n=1 Tax=Pelagibacterium limicola TaxID=2791022 RepID=UPI0018B00A70|nr:MFS transporter [Pelagibacterium limicola]
MSRQQRTPWGLVATTGALTGFGHGFAAFAVSALLKPLAVDLDTSRGTVSAAIGLGRLVAGISSPIVGRITDASGPRWIVAAGMVLTTIGLGALGFVQNEVGLYLAWSLLLSAGVAVGFTVALDKLVVAAVEHKRGMALAVRFSIAAVVSSLLVPVVTVMVETIGWRQTCLAWAGFMALLVPVPLIWFRAERLIPPPVPGRTAPDLEPVPVPDRQRMRTILGRPAFWIVAVAFAVQAAVTTGLSIHLVPLMTDYGLDPVFAGSLFGAMILLSIPVRLLSGFVADRVDAQILPFILGGLLVLEGLAIGSFALAPGFGAMLIVVFALGISAGAPTLLVLVLCSRLFGDGQFATVQGSLMMLQVPGTMAAPMIAGYSYDFTGSYVSVIAGFGLILVLGGCLLGFVRTRTLQVER